MKKAGIILATPCTIASAFLLLLDTQSVAMAGDSSLISNASTLSCQVPIESTLAGKIDTSPKYAGSQVTFSGLKSSPFNDPNATIQDLVLTLTFAQKTNVLRGKLKIDDFNINGFTIRLFNGRKLFDQSDDAFGKYKFLPFISPLWYWFQLFKFFGLNSNAVVHLHGPELVIASSEPFSLFVQKIFKNKGQITLRLPFGIKIVSASLWIKGTKSVSCPGPSPTPTPSPTATPTPTVTPTPSSSPSPSPTPVAPTTQINTIIPSSKITASRTIQFDFSSNQTGVTFGCSLDNGASQPCNSPQVYSSLSNGSHTFSVTATNSAGLSSDPTGATYEWVIDSTPPSVSIDSTLPAHNPTFSTSIQLFFTGSKSGTYYCSLDGGMTSQCSSPVTYSLLNEGMHDAAIYGVDSLGNIGAAAHYQWRVDLTAPQVSMNSATPSGNVVNQNQIAFLFSANETSVFKCSLDPLSSADFQTCTSPFTINHVAEGLHDFQVIATDLAGNVGNTLHYTWTADYTAPVIQFGNMSPSIGFNNSNSVSVEFLANETVTFACVFDGAVSNPCQSPYTASGLSEGPHTFYVTATDLAGNISAPLTAHWIMDFTAPSISFGSMTPSMASSINSPNLTVQVNASEDVTLQAVLDHISVPMTGPVLALSDLTEGAHTLQISAIDGAGNLAADPLIHSFIVDLTAPTLGLDSTTAGALTNQTSNTISFSASEQITAYCDLNGGGFSLCTSPVTYTGLASGDQVFSFYVKDTAGNVSQTLQTSWNIDTTPPSTSITSINPAASTTPLTDASFSFTSSKSNSTFMCSLDGNNPTACNSPQAYSGLAQGSHRFAVYAVDAVGNKDPNGATYNWTIDSTPLTIQGLTATQITASTALITWTTNKPTTTSLVYGPNGVLNKSAPTDASLTTSHSIPLSGLSSFTVYSYQASGTDAAGNSGTSAVFVFRTTR